MKEIKTNEKIAVGIFFTIIWLFVTGVMAFFSYLACEILFKGGVIVIILILLKGGYVKINGILRKRKHPY